MSEKTPISNFLNGLTNKVRETEQKLNKPKRNWDSESQSHGTKSFKDFDVEASLGKAEEKLGAFSSTVSTKFSQAVSRLNEKVNADTNTGENVDKEKNTAFSDAMGGLDSEEDKSNSKSIEEEVEELMKTTPTSHSTSSNRHLNDLGDKWNKHVANEQNMEKFDRLMSSLNHQLHSLTEKANAKINNAYLHENVSSNANIVHFYSGKGISSGSEFLKILDEHKIDDTSSFGVVIDPDNDNNSLFVALLAAKNNDYSFINLDLTNLDNNDISKQKIRRSFVKIRDFLSEESDDCLITVDVRHSSKEAVNSFVKSLYNINISEESFITNKKVLVLADDLAQLVVEENKKFDEVYNNSVVFEY